MKKNFLEITKASSAITQLVSNVEGVEYKTDYIPVDIKVSGGLETYIVFLIYKDNNKETMLEEISDKFKDHDVRGFLDPSENYVQIAFFPEDHSPRYKRSITFSTNHEIKDRADMVSCIVDPKYTYIDEVMNRWFDFDEKLEVHKDDDIYQYIDSISKKYEKKSFVKKLFKNKNKTT